MIMKNFTYFNHNNNCTIIIALIIILIKFNYVCKNILLKKTSFFIKLQ